MRHQSQTSVVERASLLQRLTSISFDVPYLEIVAIKVAVTTVTSSLALGRACGRGLPLSLQEMARTFFWSKGMHSHANLRASLQSVSTLAAVSDRVLSYLEMWEGNCIAEGANGELRCSEDVCFVASRAQGRYEMVSDGAGDLSPVM